MVLGLFGWPAAEILILIWKALAGRRLFAVLMCGIMKNLFWSCLGWFFALPLGCSIAQPTVDRPALVVGIVVDQMRYDFLYRYYDKYGEKGIKRMLKEGFSCENLHFDYLPTYTGPGHASIYTGTTPALHGIAGNDWYERNIGRQLYCVQDDKVVTVGGGEKAGKMSPANLQSTTIGDQLRLAFNQRSKVVAVALKDRASILPGGFNPNGAYWYDSETGNFITSTYYTAALPEWVKAFNNRKLSEQYRKQTWNTLLPITQYTESTADNQTWEGELWPGKAPVFPYSLAAAGDKGFDIITKTPFGNTLTTEMAKAAVQGEQLGKDAYPDLLAVSYSSTDIIGHIFGPQSIEVEDTYLRFDRELSDLLDFLDKEVGVGKYVAFLTADHGVMDVPAYSASLKIPSRLVNRERIQDELKQALEQRFARNDLIEYIINMQVYWHEKNLAAAGITKKQVTAVAQEVLSKNEDILAVVDVSPGAGPYPLAYLNEKISKGIYPRRSGDLLIVLKPGVLEGARTKGTSHGSPFEYDTHVPLLWYGWQIQQGSTFMRCNISDIASTVAALLKIQPPNANIGNPIALPLKP